MWVGGISEKQLKRLYSAKAGTPLLSRATQGQFAPGSTWKPFMTAGALTNGFSEDTQLDCSSGFQVGNRVFKNYESGAYGYIGFAKALEVSCNTFFYRVGYNFWQKYGTDVDDVQRQGPAGRRRPRSSASAARPASTCPGEASGRIADRKWKLAYYKSMKDFYCGIADKPQDAKTSDFVYKFAREFCIEGYAYRAGDAVNFAIGQGDTIVTPLQLARAYAALANGGTLYEPRVGKAIVGPDGTVLRRIKPRSRARSTSRSGSSTSSTSALKGVTRQGTMAWRMGGFPLDQVTVRSKTGSAEVYGKQSTSWVASYTKDYVVVMMVSQGGTGSGTSGPAIRKIWETLYGIKGDRGRTRERPRSPAPPRRTRLPVFAEGRLDPAAGPEGRLMAAHAAPPPRPAQPPPCARPGSTGC